MAATAILEKFQMAISPQRLTIYLYSAHRAGIFAIAQLSCLLGQYLVLYSALRSCLDYCVYSLVFFLVLLSMANKDSFIIPLPPISLKFVEHFGV